MNSLPELLEYFHAGGVATSTCAPAPPTRETARIITVDLRDEDGTSARLSLPLAAGQLGDIEPGQPGWAQCAVNFAGTHTVASLEQFNARYDHLMDRYTYHLRVQLEGVRFLPNPNRHPQHVAFAATDRFGNPRVVRRTLGYARITALPEAAAASIFAQLVPTFSVPPAPRATYRRHVFGPSISGRVRLT